MCILQKCVAGPRHAHGGENRLLWRPRGHRSNIKRQVKTGRPAYVFMRSGSVSFLGTSSSCKCSYSAYIAYSAQAHILRHISFILFMRTCCKSAFTAYLTYSVHAHMLRMLIYCIYRLQVRICSIYRILCTCAHAANAHLLPIKRVSCTCAHARNAHFIMSYILHMRTCFKCAFTE